MNDTPRKDHLIKHAPIGLRPIPAFDQAVELVDALERELNSANERIKRLEEVGDAMAAWLSNPRNLGDDPFMASQWRKAKEAKP